jgi:hypothetical protein
MGVDTANQIRACLDRIIDGLPSGSNGLRTFTSSQLGSRLMPWPEPLAQLRRDSRECLGSQASQGEVEERAGLWFGLFVWERIMKAKEPWKFYDPNLSAADPNRDPTGKIYFEQEADG